MDRRSDQKEGKDVRDGGLRKARHSGTEKQGRVSERRLAPPVSHSFASAHISNRLECLTKLSRDTDSNPYTIKVYFFYRILHLSGIDTEDILRVFNGLV